MSTPGIDCWRVLAEERKVERAACGEGGTWEWLGGRMWPQAALCPNSRSTSAAMAVRLFKAGGGRGFLGPAGPSCRQVRCVKECEV